MLLDLILSSRLFNWFFGTMHGRDEREDVTPTRIAASTFALAILAGCGGGGGGGGGAPVMLGAVPPQKQEAAREEPLKPVCTAEINGDSISAGQSLSGTLPVPLAERIRQHRPMWILQDNSVAGQSAAMLAPAFPNKVRSARVVVLALGTNDLSVGTSPAEPIRAMAEYAKAEGRKVVIAGIPQMRDKHPRWDEFNADEMRTAQEVGAVWAGWPEVQGETLDGVHPTQAFSDALADRLVVAIESALPECR